MSALNVASLPNPGNIARRVFPNGVVGLAYENFSSPSVVVHGWMWAGGIDVPAEQTGLASLTVAEARAYLGEGHFPPGSMGPKMRAACRFLEEGGERVLITDIYTLTDALDGKTGTWVTA